MIFLATKRRNLRVVIEPRIAREIGGQRVMGGMFEKYPAGRTIEFVDGEFHTDDKELIKDIKAHVHYGVDFVSSEKDEAPVAPTDQALREQNEKAEIVEELGSQCPKCGKEFKNAAAVNGHLATHKDE